MRGQFEVTFGEDVQRLIVLVLTLDSLRCYVSWSCGFHGHKDVSFTQYQKPSHLLLESKGFVKVECVLWNGQRLALTSTEPLTLTVKVSIYAIYIYIYESYEYNFFESSPQPKGVEHDYVSLPTYNIFVYFRDVWVSSCFVWVLLMLVLLGAFPCHRKNLVH